MSASVNWQFGIEWSSDPMECFSTTLYLSDPILFERIGELGFSLNKPFSTDAQYVRYSIDELQDSPKLAGLLDLLSSHGFDPHDGVKSPNGFKIQKLRSYSKSDIDVAEFLKPIPVRLAWIADCEESDDNRFILEANRRLKNKMPLGWVEMIGTIYVDEGMKDSLLSTGLNGVSFDEAVYDKPEKAARMLYRLTSEITLPPCLLGIMGNGGKAAKPDGARFWNDFGFVPAELRYDRDEIDSLKPFDIAMTSEKVGGVAQYHHHDMVISQAFRKKMEELKIKDLDYIPVRIVDN